MIGNVQFYMYVMGLFVVNECFSNYQLPVLTCFKLGVVSVL